MIIGEIIQNRKIEAVIPSYIFGSGSSSRRDIENISGMAGIVCEGEVSRGVYNDVLLLTDNIGGYIVGNAEIIELEEES